MNHYPRSATRAESAAAIEAKLRAVMTQFRERGTTKDGRDTAVSDLRCHRGFDREPAGQILRCFMTEPRLGLAPGFLDEQIERASKLSLGEINAFIRDFYDPTRFSMLRAVPK